MKEVSDVSWPDKVESGTSSDRILLTTDIFPTALEADSEQVQSVYAEPDYVGVQQVLKNRVNELYELYEDDIWDQKVSSVNMIMKF